MKIEFKEGQGPQNTRLQSMSSTKLEELGQYLEENLEKEWICRLKFPVLSTYSICLEKRWFILCLRQLLES